MTQNLVHLICGSTGAGKSASALELCRDAGPGEMRHLSFAITREMFDFVEATWQAPDTGEMTRYNGIRTGNGDPA